jgi:aspartate/glutamate racemase
MNEEQAYWLNKVHLKKNIHIAWDMPQIDLADKLREVIKYIKPYKLTCYVLVGFNSTIEQDLYRLRRLKELGITPFVMPFRDYENERKPSAYERDLARWANKMWLFKSMDFPDFEPRKGFKCSNYLKDKI